MMSQLKEEIKRSKQLMGVKEGLNLPKQDLGPQKPEEYTMTCSIKLQGFNYRDLKDALDECGRQLESEYRLGRNSNEDSSYSFSVTGEEWNEPTMDDDEY